MRNASATLCALSTQFTTCFPGFYFCIRSQKLMGDALDTTYGAMFIGVLFATFFQGVLTLQAYIYYESFPKDHASLKVLVASVWILDVAHLVLICQSCYHYLISSWGNNAALLVSTQELDLHLVFVGMASALCQGFFLSRIWTFSQKNWVLTGILCAACLTTLALETAMSAQISRVPSVAAFGSFTGEVVATLGLSAAVDVAIAAILVWYLQQGKTSFDRTSFVVARVVQYTVATGLATSLLAVACLAVYLATPHTFIFIALHFSLGRMYTNALLATLNSRRNLRKVLDDSGTVGPHTGTSFLGGMQGTNMSSTNEQESSALTQRSRKDVSLVSN
ncbi:ANK-REP-REGION domain-containing protein [Mycena venus]|uniref:ANK-REP-REGION domain-containing protein n=1 Tax=Mycena venus TaxID=2733690 RepID=A0A8H6YFA4_9AGAR|nr:ANK-REP-REGION domain-containing protein [Mycena venus]